MVSWCHTEQQSCHSFVHLRLGITLEGIIRHD